MKTEKPSAIANTLNKPRALTLAQDFTYNDRDPKIISSASNHKN
jgi:hypothetical protein